MRLVCTDCCQEVYAGRILREEDTRLLWAVHELAHDDTYLMTVGEYL